MTLSKRVLDEVARERERQERKFALRGWTCADPAIPDREKLPVLIEEVGEVARAMLEGTYRPDQAERLWIELVQVAAVAVAWAEAISAEFQQLGDPRIEATP